ncbi:serine acetyltransferase [Endozoicomonas sp. OPT23]|uniref:serine acetyltransferase n=1 Tax=Endozoicomonas sp. OPT23 TaxID=2072845 RepID=UPI00129ABADC|nr:serine acetyltransferase [Endozoicomonas sp. OPT23]
MQENHCSFREFLIIEVLNNKKFSWLKVIRKVLRKRQCHYLFWFRAAYLLYNSNNTLKRSIAKRINKRLITKHNIEIMLGANIDIGLQLLHMTGIVISDRAKIGKNFYIRQNSTIGFSGFSGEGEIVIGDNVTVGTNSCIIANNLKIGDNVNIGAMTFINKDIPSNSTVINKKDITFLPNR